MANLPIQMVTEEKELFEKYEHLVGDLVETKNPNDKRRAKLIAQMLENQEVVAPRSEARFGGSVTGAILESDQTTATPPLSVFPNQFAGPILDTIYRQLVAFDIVDVTTMQFPRQSILIRDYVQSASPNRVLQHDYSYASTAEAGSIPKARLKFDYTTMEAKKYAFQAMWTSELFQDARAFGQDIDSLVMNAVAQEIRGEIDWLILNDLFTLGASSDGAGNTNWDSTAFVSASYGQNIREYNKGIWDAIVDARNKIFKKSLLMADYLVCGADAAARLEKLWEFRAAPGFEQAIGTAGTFYLGTLNGQFKVYRSVAVPASKILVGSTQAGYTYAVYVPLALSQQVYVVDTDETAQNITTRFATHCQRPAGLATVTIT